MNQRNYQHVGPRRRQWWRGPGLPAVLLLVMIGVLIWELSWALPLLNGG